MILVCSYFIVEGNVPYRFDSDLLIHQVRYCIPYSAVVTQWVCLIFDVDILILFIMFCQLKELNSPEDDIRTSFKNNVYCSEQDRVQTLSDPYSNRPMSRHVMVIYRVFYFLID
jgi:hypothetical protein